MCFKLTFCVYEAKLCQFTQDGEISRSDTVAFWLLL